MFMQPVSLPFHRPLTRWANWGLHILHHPMAKQNQKREIPAPDLPAHKLLVFLLSESVQQILRRATALEATYLLKLMLADMRIGVKQPLIEEAIAVASNTEVTAVRHAVMLEADLALVVRMAFAGTLADAHLRLYHPLGFMLASPVETPEEAVAEMNNPPIEIPKISTSLVATGRYPVLMVH